VTFFGMALLTAIGTLVLAVFAVVTAWYARKAFQKQAQEVAILLEQNKRDIDERRRAQASRVFLVEPPEDAAPSVQPSVHNASDLPVYYAMIWASFGLGDSRPEHQNLGTIMPGGTASPAQPFSAYELIGGTVLTFNDTAGAYWARWPDGVLAEFGTWPQSSDDFVKLKAGAKMMRERPLPQTADGRRRRPPPRPA
jgi:hypothetical protein